MSRRFLALAPVVAALTLAAPALADAQSVTATGTANVKVVPANRHSNASIASAVAVAQKQAVPGALVAARAKALLYAQDASLTLGAVLSVSDAQNGQVFVGPYGIGGDIGPFGPGKYCGIERRPVFKKVGKRVKVIRLRKVHACVVPAYASSTLTVTYSAT
ncbi:MAG TPA: hypothetical protein VG294_14990 [Solirubrobacteraceae bacterium]|jgi:hypothetical protein|nr:hypothetical protein [Solirubrobacteraceae bacterium]